MIKKKCSEIAAMLNIECIKDYVDVEINGVEFDSRKILKNQLFIPLVGENVNGHDFVESAIQAGATCCLWNESLPNPPTNIAVLKVKDTMAAFSLLARRYRESFEFPIVGITGSNGKTSTKDILAGILSEKYNVMKTQGNYNSESGVPYTLLSFDENLDVGIVEMGMENPNEISQLCQMVQPDISIITNVGSAHLENLGSMENIAKAKCEILEGMKPTGLFIYNGNDEYLVQEVMQHDFKGQKQTFGLVDCDCMVSDYSQNEEYSTYHINLCGKVKSPMLGFHQALNSCAAVIVAKQLGFTSEEIIEGFSKIEKTKWRTQIEHIGMCTVLNDAYKSNPQSARAALETMKELNFEHNYVVFGDMFDLGENSDQYHYELGKSVASYEVDLLYCIGENSRFIQEGALSQGMKCLWFEKAEDLVKALVPLTQQACLLLVKGSRGMHLDKVIDRLKESQNEQM